MSRITKNKKAVQDKYDINKYYTVEEASKLVKEISTTKFDASIDLYTVSYTHLTLPTTPYV